MSIIPCSKRCPLTSYTGADRDMADKINTVKSMGKGITNRMAQAFIENALVPSTGPGWFGSGVDINMAGIVLPLIGILLVIQIVIL